MDNAKDNPWARNRSMDIAHTIADILMAARDYREQHFNGDAYNRALAEIKNPIFTPSRSRYYGITCEAAVAWACDQACMPILSVPILALMVNADEEMTEWAERHRTHFRIRT